MNFLKTNRLRLIALMALAAIVAFAATGAFATSRPSKPSVKGPHNPTGRTNAVFRFRSHGRVRYLCGLDGAALRRCSSPKKYSGLDDGSHTFRVKALNGKGKSSRTASYRWVIDTTNPAVTEIKRAQPSPTNAGTLTWTVRFTKPVSGLAAGNLRLATAHLGGSAPTISSVTPQGGSRSQTWNVAVSTAGTSGADDGSIGLDLANGTGVRDAANNAVEGSFSGEAYRFDTSAPGAPTNLVGPDDPSVADPASKSKLTWQNGGGDTAGFRCQLDGGAYSACSSPLTYNGLGEGAHTFRVVAVDAAGNQSAATAHSWNVLKSPKNWSIAGDVPAGGLFPGASAARINLSLNNQNPYTLTVQSIALSIQSVTKAAGAPTGTCAASNFATTNLTGGTFTLPTGHSTLSSLGIATSRWPTLRMVETGLNQDACKGATVKLSYQGVATK